MAKANVLPVCRMCGHFHASERRCYYELLIEALGPTALSLQDLHYLRWLAGWDSPTCDAFCSLFRKLRGGVVL